MRAVVKKITIEGIEYELSHLQPFITTVSGKGKEGGDIRVAVSLSRHTISKSCESSQKNMTDEKGKPRMFCSDRYAFSVNLPALISTMISNNYFAWESIDRNRASNYAIIDVHPQNVHLLVDGYYWAIFFYLYPADGCYADVNFAVTSCHSRKIIFRHVKRRYTIHSLLRTCLFKVKRVP
jgi:hypothetical protein